MTDNQYINSFGDDSSDDGSSTPGGAGIAQPSFNITQQQYTELCTAIGNLSAYCEFVNTQLSSILSSVRPTGVVNLLRDDIPTWSAKLSSTSKMFPPSL